MLATAVAACSAESLQLPKLDSFSQAIGGEGKVSTASTEPSLEAYSRIARGALKCWFGAQGSLKATHTFHARAEPPSAGGGAQILVQARGADDPRYGALIAYRISIAPSAGGSAIETENARFTKAQGVAMTADVRRWLAGSSECEVMGAGGWGANAPAGGENNAKSRKK